MFARRKVAGMHLAVHAAVGLYRIENGDLFSRRTGYASKSQNDE